MGTWKASMKSSDHLISTATRLIVILYLLKTFLKLLPLPVNRRNETNMWRSEKYPAIFMDVAKVSRDN